MDGKCDICNSRKARFLIHNQTPKETTEYCPRCYADRHPICPTCNERFAYSLPHAEPWLRHRCKCTGGNKTPVSLVQNTTYPPTIEEKVETKNPEVKEEKNMTALELAIQETAEEINEDPSIIRQFRPNWKKVVEGVIAVDLDVRYWRGETSLQLKDLGLDNAPKEYQERILSNFSLGHKRLIPHEFKKQLIATEDRARNLLLYYSYTSGWGHLMPRKAYIQWKEEMVLLKDRFYLLRDELVEKRDEIVKEMREKYTDAAEMAYKVREGMTLENSVEVPSQFVEDFTNSILARIPSAEQIYRSFSMEWKVSYVVSPLEIEEERIQIEEIQRESARRAEMDEATWIATRTRMAEEKDYDQEIQAKIQEGRREKIDGVIELVSSRLREMLYEASLNTLDSIKKNGKVVGGNVIGIRSLVQRIRILNFAEDQEVNEMLTALQSQLGEGNSGDLTKTIDTLQQVGILARAELLSLGRTPRSGRELEIPDTIDEGTLRKARNRVFAPVQEALPLERAARTI